MSTCTKIFVSNLHYHLLNVAVLRKRQKRFKSLTFESDFLSSPKTENKMKLYVDINNTCSLENKFI